MAKTCPDCNGSGIVYFFDTQETCNTCGGSGIDPTYDDSNDEETYDDE